MFTALLAEHQQKQAAQREENEKARRDASQAVAVVTDALVRSVNDGVSDVFNNQRIIEAEARELQLQAVQFNKQTTKWVGMVNEFDKALKEVGDFENWLKTIEWDMQTIGTALDNATARIQEKQGGAAAGAGAGGASAQQQPGSAGVRR